MSPVDQVTLSEYWIARCRELGERIVGNFRNRNCEASRAYSFGGLDEDPEAQAFYKMGEVAFCLWARLDPNTAMNWSGLPDSGHDVIYRGLLVDVKTIEPYKRKMLWSVKKNDIYLSKKFQVLVLVKGELPHFSVVRWIDKAAFFCEKRIADRTPGLIDGTWHMDEAQLWPIELFKRFVNEKAA